DVTGSEPAPDAAKSSPFAGNVERAGAQLVGGGGWQTAAQLAPFVMTTLVSIVAARELGPSDMGRQSYIAFIVLAAVTVASAGFTGTIPRYIGELIGKGEEGRVASLCAWAWRIELMAAAVATIVLLAVAAAGATPRLAWIFGAIGAAA